MCKVVVTVGGEAVKVEGVSRGFATGNGRLDRGDNASLVAAVDDDEVLVEAEVAVDEVDVDVEGAEDDESGGRGRLSRGDTALAFVVVALPFDSATVLSTNALIPAGL